MHLDDATVLGLVEGRLRPEVIATVDEHLDSCPSCRDVVALLARGTGTARGDVIGKYVVGDLLGTGAMGRVYSAWDPELDRRVALKLIDGADRARVVKEAQAMAKLSHPNVVTVHEVGETDDGVYVAMELVAGKTLRAWAQQPRAWRDVARVVGALAQGLVGVHAAGVVHRDVKPDNVIIGDDGRVRIGDFGLARADGVAQPGIEASSVAGTPAYMAPEVLRGGRADAASDQFSFGVVAYELLSGKRPFAGASWNALLAAIDVGAPPALVGVPGWLDAAVRRCIAAEPGKRFPTMARIAQLIESRMSRRSPAIWLGAACAAALVASGATWVATRSHAVASCNSDDPSLAQIWNDNVRAHLASAPAATAVDRRVAAFQTERAALCTEVTEPPARVAARERCLDQRRGELAALLNIRQDPPPLYLPTGSDGFVQHEPPGRAPVYSADAVIDALTALPAPSECRVADGGDAVPADRDRARAVREVAAALPAVRAAVAAGTFDVTSAERLVMRAQASEHAPTIAEALIVDADALRGAGKLTAAVIAARDAVAAAERGHADDTAARAWLARVAAAGDRRDLDAADDVGAIAAGAIARAGSPAKLAAQLARMRGEIAYARGKLDDARALLSSARAQFVALAGEHSVEVAGTDSALGSVARAAGDLNEAEARHRAALALDRELRGPKHIDIARDLHNIAGVLRLRGDLDGALASYHAALAIEAPDSIAAGLTHNSLGLVEMTKRDWPAAKTELERARDLLDAAGHGDRAFAEHNLGLVAQATGDHPAALDHFARAGAVYTSTIGDDAPASTRLWLDRARSERALGNEAAARADAEHAAKSPLGWVADDARAFLSEEHEDHHAPPRPAPPKPIHRPNHIDLEAPDHTVMVGEEPSHSKLGAPAETAPAPAPAAPQPKRDVGVYGSQVSF